MRQLISRRDPVPLTLCFFFSVRMHRSWLCPHGHEASRRNRLEPRWLPRKAAGCKEVFRCVDHDRCYCHRVLFVPARAKPVCRAYCRRCFRCWPRDGSYRPVVAVSQMNMSFPETSSSANAVRSSTPANMYVHSAFVDPPSRIYRPSLMLRLLTGLTGEDGP